jgi:hypothetical protein
VPEPPPTLDDFRAAVGGTFALHAGDGLGLELRLVDAQATGDRAAGVPRDPFRLAFLGPADPSLPQRTYRLEHDALGELDVFLVPIGRDAGGTTYEAIFA